MSVVERVIAVDRPPSFGRQIAARLSGRQVAYPLGYFAALDGTRGLMTIGVLVAHTNPRFLGAFVYMDIFFVMSGYLITSLLIKDYQKRGRISLRNFYLRRMMRLYPALTAMIIGVIAAAWLFSPSFTDVLKEALVSWFYLMDYERFFISTPIVYTGHTWSLAVEEQFYLIWPLAFIVLLRVSGLTLRTALITFAAAAAFWGWKIAFNYDGGMINHVYAAFDCRADALLIGCGLAVLLKAIDISSYPRFYKFCSQSLPAGAVGMIIVGFTLEPLMRWCYYVAPLIGSIPAALGVIGLLHPQRTFMHKFYEHPIPVFIGRICYGLYIWHLPVFVLIAASFPQHRYLMVFLIGWPIAFALATLSHYLIERPFMRARPGF